MRRFLASAGAAALAAAAAGSVAQAQAPWNPKAPENSQHFPAFTVANVETVLGSIGAKWQRTGTDPNRPMFIVSYPNGRRGIVALQSCGAGGACKALVAQATWTRPRGATGERLSQAVERFNQRYSFAKAFVTAGGRPGLQRYLTADYGYIRGNLAVNLLVFATQADRFHGEVIRPLEAAK